VKSNTTPATCGLNKGPQPRLEEFAAAPALALDRRVVQLDDSAREDPFFQRALDRFQLVRAGHDPVAHRLARQSETLAPEDRLLAVQRQVVGVLLHQDPGQEPGADAHVFERLHRSGCHDRLGLALGLVFGAQAVHMAVVDDDDQARGAVLEYFALLLAHEDEFFLRHRAHALQLGQLVVHVLARQSRVGQLARRVAALVARANAIRGRLAVGSFVHARRRRQRSQLEAQRELALRNALGQRATLGEQVLQAGLEQLLVARGSAQLGDERSDLVFEFDDALQPLRQKRVALGESARILLEHVLERLLLVGQHTCIVGQRARILLEHVLERAVLIGQFVQRRTHADNYARKRDPLRIICDISAQSGVLQLARRRHLARSRNSPASRPLSNSINSS